MLHDRAVSKLLFHHHGNYVQNHVYMAVCQNLVPLVNIKIAGKWMFIPLKMVLIGIDPYPHGQSLVVHQKKQLVLVIVHFFSKNLKD